MDPSKLFKDELVYELHLRGFDNLRGETAASMRKQLTEILQGETFGELVVSQTFEPPPIEEVRIVLAKVETLENLVASKPIVVGGEICLQVDTKLRHLTARLQRLQVEDTEDNKATLRAIDNLLGRLERVEELVDEKISENRLQVLATINNSTGSGSTVPGPSGVTSIPQTIITNIHKNQVEPRKWGIVFDGERSSSISAFFEQVEERRRASNVSERELLASAVDILKGSALIFFRSIRDEVTSWDDFKSRFREQFQPFDYQQELLQEIRKRSQGPDESVGIFFACVKNLFARLPTPIDEVEKVNILRRNVHPYFIHNLGLAEFNTVEELLKLCKRLEVNRNIAERSQPPPTENLLERDLSCPAGSSNVSRPAFSQRNQRMGVNIAEVEESKCWNCLRTGHRFNNCRERRTRKFCFGCGSDGCIKKDCRRCSGNASGDVTAGQRR